LNFDRGENYSLQNLFDECKRLIDFHIILVMKDGSSVDGILENVDSNGIIMLVGEDVIDLDDMPMPEGQRQFGGGRGMRRRRRFRRRGFPFNNVRGVFPFFFPFPFFPFF
jgi:small nuclear ribonucleoprotein (snRNP)-like protein